MNNLEKLAAASVMRATKATTGPLRSSVAQIIKRQRQLMRKIPNLPDDMRKGILSSTSAHHDPYWGEFATQFGSQNAQLAKKLHTGSAMHTDKNTLPSLMLDRDRNTSQLLKGLGRNSQDYSELVSQLGRTNVQTNNLRDYLRTVRTR